MQCRLAAALGTMLLVLAGPISAQVPGLPVYGGGFSTGITFAGVAGFSPSDTPTGKATAFGVSGTLGVGMLGLTGIVARVDPSGSGTGRDSFTQVGGLATVKAFGGPLIPLALYLQGGYSRRTIGQGSNETTMTSVPLGVSISLVIPSVVVAIRPWIAPRLQFSRVSGPGLSGPGGGSSTDTDFAFGAGVDLTTLSGFGFRAMAEKIGGSDPIVALGLAYAIRVPGL